MYINAVKVAIATGVASRVAGLECRGFMPDLVVPPCFCVGAVRIPDPRMTFKGRQRALIDTYVFVSDRDPGAGQEELDGYLAETGSGSVLAALYSMRAVPGTLPLGGAAHTIAVTSIEGYRKYPFGDAEPYGALIEVEVTG
jgi:hypothetical protein